MTSFSVVGRLYLLPLRLVHVNPVNEISLTSGRVGVVGPLKLHKMDEKVPRHQRCNVVVPLLVFQQFLL